MRAEKERFKTLDIAARELSPFGELPTFSGTWVNVIHGRRVTTDQPETRVGRVLCLGGSTTFCGDVSDSDTWPSVLQRSLNDAGLRVQVENLGRMGATAINRLGLIRDQERLEDVRVVVLLFGINDAGWVQLRDLVDLPILVRRMIASRLGLTQVVYRLAGRRIGRRCGIAAARKTISELEVAADLLSHHKTRFLVALQPHYWLNRERPNLIGPGSTSPFAVRPDFLSALDGAYEIYRNSLPKLNSIEYLNLESSLDKLGDSGYIDWAHNSTVGCQTIGQIIGLSVKRLLSNGDVQNSNSS